MFKKPLKIKSNTKLKNSESKAIREDLTKAFPQIESNIENVLPKKESMFCVRVLTNDSTQVQVYVVQQRAIAFKFNNSLFPTVYFLWKFPDVMMSFTTNSFVSTKIMKGADLMLAGVYRTKTFERDFPVHAPACVNTCENKAAVAVGVTAKSCREMLRDLSNGKCVLIYHWYGDYLCSLENLPSLPYPSLGRLNVVDSESEESDKDVDGNLLEEKSESCSEKNENCDAKNENCKMKNYRTKNENCDTKNKNCDTKNENCDTKNENCHTKNENCTTKNERDKNKNLNEKNAWSNTVNKTGDETANGDIVEKKSSIDMRQISEAIENLSAEDISHGTNESVKDKEDIDEEVKKEEVKKEEVKKEELKKEEPTETSVEDMDKLIKACFLAALKYSKTLKIPILTSSFYKLEMITSCPMGKNLDIKKTSYKKLGQFLKRMMKEGVITVKEQKKGAEYITAVNENHDMLKEFYLEKELRPVKMEVEKPSSAAPSIIESYIVTPAILPLFKEFNVQKGDLMQERDIRNHITNYVKNHNCQDLNNKRIVKLQEPHLAALFKDKDEVTWEELMTKVCSMMKSCYKVTGSVKAIEAKGKIQPITMKVETRSGNKKVTLVDNIELFGISISEFAKECQHGVSASASTSKAPGKKSDQLMVQGNQVLFIHHLLTEKYKLPIKYIKGLEFAPKNKK